MADDTTDLEQDLTLFPILMRLKNAKAEVERCDELARDVHEAQRDALLELGNADDALNAWLAENTGHVR